MLVYARLSESLIKARLTDSLITELRAQQAPTLKLRFHKLRKRATWLLWDHKLWNVVGHWPEVPVKVMLAALPQLSLAHTVGNKEKVSAQPFDCVGDLLEWYQARTQQNAHISEARRRDIKSAIEKHLQPALATIAFERLNKATLDQQLIQPMQQCLASSTVIKYFAILKAAFSDAFKLDLIQTNPLATVRIGDFGRFRQTPKPARLHPVQVATLLNNLDQPPKWLKVLMMLQLTLGTRLGETLQARWQDVFLAEGVWHLPASHTKTKQAHQLPLPTALVHLLRAWRESLSEQRLSHYYLFPRPTGAGRISAAQAMHAYRQFSEGRFSSHDVRKCARTCWSEHEVDFMVAEKLLNHSLGKVAETYLASQVLTRQRQAIEAHSQWLINQCPTCFQLVTRKACLADTISTRTLTAFPAEVSVSLGAGLIEYRQVKTMLWSR